ncbi:hypothetical protein P9112_008713 [Eukaryota sp. TZLM1-RC]
MSRHSAIQEMSQRLLNGWSLCESVHDKCSLPLVCNPQAEDSSKKYFCSHCRIYMADDEDQSSQFVSNTPVPSPSFVNSSPHKTEKCKLEMEDRAEPLELEEETESVHSASDLESSDDESVVSYEKDTQNVSNLDNISGALAEKMLQGYTLLETLCPGCATPLVSKEDSMYCVSCQCRVVTEAEFDEDTMKKIEPTEEEEQQPVSQEIGKSRRADLETCVEDDLTIDIPDVKKSRPRSVELADEIETQSVDTPQRLQKQQSNPKSKQRAPIMNPFASEHPKSNVDDSIESALFELKSSVARRLRQFSGLLDVCEVSQIGSVSESIDSLLKLVESLYILEIKEQCSC